MSENQCKVGSGLVSSFLAVYLFYPFIYRLKLPLTFCLPSLSSAVYSLLSNISKRLLIIGLLLKLISGMVSHSSTFSLPWSFPLVTGIADNVFFFSLLLIVLVTYSADFSASISQLLLFIILFLLFIVAGFRPSLLIPLFLLLILRLSNSIRVRGVTYNIVLCLGIVFFVDGFLGIARTLNFDLTPIPEVSVQRLSDLIWPVKLVSLIEDGQVTLIPSYFFADLLGFLPSFIQVLLLSHTVFEQGTMFMEQVGIAQVTMSVPMTKFGQSHLVASQFGPYLFGFLYACSLVLIPHILQCFSEPVSLFLFLLIYMYIIVLPLGTLADLVSLLT